MRVPGQRTAELRTRGANGRWCRASEVEVDSAARHGKAAAKATEAKRQQQRELNAEAKKAKGKKRSDRV